MQPLNKRLTNLLKQIDAAFLNLKIDEKQQAINELTEELAQSDIWNNPSNAQAKNIQLSSMSNMVDPWVTLRTQVADMIELLELAYFPLLLLAQSFYFLYL